MMALFIFTACSRDKDDIYSFRVVSGSMGPMILPHDMVWVDKSAYRNADPQRFNIVAFKCPFNNSDDWVKRIIALPGETIEIRDGVIFINNSPLDDKYASEPLWPSLSNFNAFTVRPDHYFVMGDNRNHSEDSRSFGTIHKNDIIGKVTAVELRACISEITTIEARD
jgi:signal peptidase I